MKLKKTHFNESIKVEWRGSHFLINYNTRIKFTVFALAIFCPIFLGDGLEKYTHYLRK